MFSCCTWSSIKRTEYKQGSKCDLLEYLQWIVKVDSVFFSSFEIFKCFCVYGQSGYCYIFYIFFVVGLLCVKCYVVVNFVGRNETPCFIRERKKKCFSLWLWGWSNIYYTWVYYRRFTTTIWKFPFRRERYSCNIFKFNLFMELAVVNEYVYFVC